MRVTIVDIAKKANVSPSTVSRIISNDARISKATKEKVTEIMNEMGYHPNVVARSLVNKSTKTIGLIIPGITEKEYQHPCFIEALRGAGYAANKNKYNIQLTSINSYEEEKWAITELTRGGAVDGILLIGWSISPEACREIKKMDFPFVTIGKIENEENVCCVDNNNFSIGYDLTVHLLNQGCKKIAFIGYSKTFSVETERVRGYKKALEDYHISCDSRFMIEGNYIKNNGYDLIKQIFAQDIVPDGVIASDDFLAYGALQFIKEQRLKVPEDIAVVGFNNALASGYFSPSLTSVEVNSFRQGEKAVELLISRIKSSDKSYSTVIIPGDLVIRESSLRR